MAFDMETRTMRLRSLTIFVLILTALVSSALAQREEIRESEYTTVLAEALHKASTLDRRIITDESFYTGSQVTGTRRIISDFVGKDAKRIDVTEDFNGKKTRSNSITLNGQFFCKDGEKAWKRADKDCARSGKMMAIPDGEYEYFVEPDPNIAGLKVYTRRAAYTDSGSAERDEARLKFIEIKFTTDENGAITRYTETRRGGLEPNGWSSTQVTVYDYDKSDLKIDDPTRKNY